MNRVTPTSDLFLFKEANRAFLEGKSPHPLSLFSSRKIIRSFVNLWALVALPIGLIIAMITSLITKTSFPIMLLITLVVMTLITIYPIKGGYDAAQRLEKYGTVLPGKIVSYTPRLMGGVKGYRKGILMNYEIETRNGMVALSSLVSQSPTHLPDGRPLPQIGTKIAIIYLEGRQGVPL